ncbi:MAG: enoyl-CoA hydratase-related protein [Pseudomonadota bacterium]
MTYETLIVEREPVASDRALVCVTLNRPSFGNALSPVMARELAEVALDCDDDPKVAAVVLTGAGKLFCAGGDLGVMNDAGASASAVVKRMASDLHVAISRFSRMAAPTVAAVNGTAGGAGFSLMLSTDLAVASAKARFTSAYTNAGLSPDGSSTFFLPRRLGERRARELMLLNRVLSAEEALDWGLVNEIVEPEILLDHAMTLGRKLAAGPTRAYGAVKTLLNETFEHGLEAQMELETRAIADLVRSADGQEGIQAFLNKRSPTFTGR